MTRRQYDCLTFLRRWFARTPLSPSIREIAAGLGLSVGPTFRLLVALERQGLIAKPAGHFRAIRLLALDDGDLHAAARAVLGAIVSEDLERGLVVVRANAIGALDVALAEAACEPLSPQTQERVHA